MYCHISPPSNLISSHLAPKKIVMSFVRKETNIEQSDDLFLVCKYNIVLNRVKAHSYNNDFYFQMKCRSVSVGQLRPRAKQRLTTHESARGGQRSLWIVQLNLGFAVLTLTTTLHRINTRGCTGSDEKMKYNTGTVIPLKANQTE